MRLLSIHLNCTALIAENLSKEGFGALGSNYIPVTTQQIPMNYIESLNGACDETKMAAKC